MVGSHGSGTIGRAGRGAGAPGGGTGGQGDKAGSAAEMVRIVRPANGNYSSVIFGASASEPYPESAGVLTSKIIYTVYLPVGLRKNWILQYCLPKSFSTDSAAHGALAPLGAPWPTLIVRPKNNGVADGDYILVHGIITAAGRFVQLATVAPEQFENTEAIDGQARARELTLTVLDIAVKKVVPVLIAMI